MQDFVFSYQCGPSIFIHGQSDPYSKVSYKEKHVILALAITTTITIVWVNKQNQPIP